MAEPEQTEHLFVVVVRRNEASMRHFYFMIDEENRCLAPKLCPVAWPRLHDIVDYRTCVLNNCLYVTGGKDPATGEYTRQVLKYNPTINRWTECARMKKARGRHSVAAVDGKLFVAGGCVSDGEVTDHCESYEPLVNQWQAEERLPQPRVDHACFERDGHLYLSGGSRCLGPHYQGNKSFWKLEKYLAENKKKGPPKLQYRWCPLLDRDGAVVNLPRNLVRHTASLHKGKLYIIGGVTDEDKTQEMSDPGNSNNVPVPKINTGVKNHTSGDIHGFRFFTRHLSSNGRQEILRSRKSREDQRETNDLSRSPWGTSAPPLPQPRCSCATVSVGNKLYVFGGHSIEDQNRTSVNSVDYYHSRRRAWDTAFSLGDGDFSDVTCHTLTVPITNKDIRPVRYSDCKWVMW